MAQVLAAAWVGVMAGWLGFGWVLAEAPEHMAEVRVEHSVVVAGAAAAFDFKG